MEDYSHIQKPDLGYRYEFATDELDAMDECLEAHGFAIIKDLLPPEIVAKLKQAVWDGTDPERTRCSRVRAARGTLGSSPAPALGRCSTTSLSWRFTGT